MRANSLRTLASVAAFCAAIVVLAHLAYAWGDASDFQERRRIAFDHGAALAIVLAAAVWAGRLATWLERGTGRPIGDAIAIAGSIAVLLHLAWVWRDGMSDALAVTAAHLLALGLVVCVSLLGGMLDARITSTSNRLNGASIPPT
jgi:hypothetical protein